eukprot:1189343-Prorocentrum_minimum.AAC.2
MVPTGSLGPWRDTIALCIHLVAVIRRETTGYCFRTWSCNHATTHCKAHPAFVPSEDPKPVLRDFLLKMLPAVADG